ARIRACDDRTALEDLYLPFKPKRRTRASIARERGLLPLAERILAQPPSGDPRREAAPFVSAERELPDVESALAGARDIVAEVVSERADVRKLVRDTFAREAIVTSEITKAHRGKPTKFDDYAGFREPISKIAPHRWHALERGEREGVLRVKIDLEAQRLLAPVASMMGRRPGSPFSPLLSESIEDALDRLVLPSVTTDVRGALKDAADATAIDVFAANLRQLLLAPPLGAQSVLAIDPGIRTGCKCALLDPTGKLLATTTLFLSQGDAATTRARTDLVALVRRQRPHAIAVGNGTGGRETEAFVRQTLAAEGLKDVVVVSVSEAGASVYSASEVAREELPDLDVSVRGAVSIGRRLQDPLAELVKIDPKSIGVGQYQHDVDQPRLAKKLDEVVESCVNSVGVELNTASKALLSYVAGIGPVLAARIVEHRDRNGSFTSRKALGAVKGLGPRTFEQAAGFLRIRGAANPLDTSAVHPERYALVERMARDLGVPLSALVGHPEHATRIDIGRYVGADVGEPTLRDIVAELGKPGRDPRATFEAPKFRDDVHSLEDLRDGMVLEGVVTNVTAFGAFVDVGVHQDGLVHVSQLADRFVRNPSEVVRVGERVRVRVLSVDLARRRISLSRKGT
ncbi:MAG: RNA-binding transcriptional accessory protein, partial [Deltaproteobacteria bacterium]|nr:RNA-binding transcriptional accessory protein [Deltaproteobacteria bacterium]